MCLSRQERRAMRLAYLFTTKRATTARRLKILQVVRTMEPENQLSFEAMLFCYGVKLGMKLVS